jgi:anhydro-N-acetylmuramic acid kinase
MGLNYLAEKASLEFDNEGGLAARGETEGALLDQLKAAYKRIGSKRPSLAREGFESGIRPLLDIDSIPLENRMKTFCESIAYEIARSIPARKKKIKVLATGGGTWNPVLMQFLRQYLDRIAHVEIPSREIIEFKEALVFAFLGVLKVRGEVNVLKSVTRASRNSCSGVHLVPSPSP